MDGMTLAQEAHKIAPDLGTIFMTGYASLDTAKSAIKAGAYDYIMKPFELSELRKAVSKAVAKKAKLEENTGGNDLNRLSDLMQVLYNVGDRDSLLKLSLGLALLNCNLKRGLIAAWDERSGILELASTANVKEGSFEIFNQEIEAEIAEKCFAIESKTMNQTVAENNFLQKLIAQFPEIKTTTTVFGPDSKTTTLLVKSKQRFYIVLVLQEGDRGTV